MLYSIIIIGCQERGQPAKIPYIFWIKDSTGNNLVGDSVAPKRYNVDSIKSTIIFRNNQISNSGSFHISKDYYKGYFFEGGTDINFVTRYLLIYNSFDSDTISVAYGKDNINVYKNNTLIFSKYNLSQVPPVEFNIIK
ncbi:MAG: hypothetical protein IT246_09180 [Bacteroidia bacterium]|nr:hypothetical protein [Bacteroidia bacterium]